MKKLTGKTAMLAAAATTLMFGLSACQVDQTQEGEMPEVQVEGGQLPAYEVETAEVTVGTKTETVEVEVPTAEVTMPDDPEHSSNDPETPQQQ